MRLTRMQDIAGCRVIFPSVAAMNAGLQIIRDELPGEIVGVNDYVESPKPDGYRSLHLIYKWNASEKSDFDGLFVEIQLRTELQHAWATAVETVDLFTGQALKSGIGKQDWARFFVLMATAIASRENCPPVPDAPNDPLRRELCELEQRLGVGLALTAFQSTLKHGESGEQPGSHYFLLILDLENTSIIVKPFSEDRLEDATKAYSTIEEEIARGRKANAVLVSAATFHSLRELYPNYYANTTAFLNALHYATSKSA